MSSTLIMRKFLLLLLIKIACQHLAFAQRTSPTNTLRGLVVDSVTQELLSFATVLLKDVNSKRVIKSILSKENGSFEIAGLAAGHYKLTLANVGYHTKAILLLLKDSSNAIVDLGKILLVPSSTQLEEVQIKSQEALIKQDVDKISYHVASDPESKTMTALDILRKVPMITVDAEDHIRLKGSENYKILVNGKASSLLVSNPQDVFKSMPANMIQSIEVFTTPPAKYEAEGVGGIINIVTKKKDLSGYNGSIRLGGSNPKGYQAGASFTIKANKLGLLGHYSNHYFVLPRMFDNLFRRNYIPNSYQLKQLGYRNYRNRSQYLSSELSFELDTLNLFTASYGFNAYKPNNRLIQNVQNLGSAADLIPQAYSRNSEGGEKRYGYDFGIDYQRSFRNNAMRLLTLSYKLGANVSNVYNNFSLEPMLNAKQLKGKTGNDTHFEEHTIQSDYIHPIGRQALELGAKMILRTHRSNYYYQHLIASNYITDPRQTNEFSYHQYIYGIYTSFSLKQRSWALKFGGRIEANNIDASFRSLGNHIKKSYYNWIPTITLSRSLKGANTIKVAYTQRIQRPGLWHLNPYVNRIDPKNISYGNPNLKAGINHSFELSYNAFIKNLSFNTSLYYNFTNNSIEKITTSDTAGVSRTKYENIGKKKSWDWSIYTDLPLTEKLNFRISGLLNYIYFESFVNGTLMSHDGVAATIFTNMTCNFNKGWAINASLGHSSPWIMVQGQSNTYWYNSYSVSKLLLKDKKGTVALSISNPFQKDQRWSTEISNINFYQLQEIYFRSRRFQLVFTYHFGKLASDISHKKRGIHNDDIKTDKDRDQASF